MFDKFSEKSVKIIMLAQEEARRLGHDYVSPEFILLGIIGAAPTIAEKNLKLIGVDLERARGEVEKQLGRGSGLEVAAIPFSQSAKLLLEGSLAEARQQNVTYITSAHILLSLLSIDDASTRAVIKALDIEAVSLRKSILSAIFESHTELSSLILKREDEPISLLEELGLYNRSLELSRVPKVRNALLMAQEEARRLGHNSIGSEAILLGLIGDSSGIAGKVLKEVGVDLENTRIEVEKIVGHGSGFVAEIIPFTPRSKRILERAWDEMRLLKHNNIETEHWLLALIQEREGVGAKVLESVGVDLDDLKARILAAIEKQ